MKEFQSLELFELRWIVPQRPQATRTRGFQKVLRQKKHGLSRFKLQENHIGWARTTSREVLPLPRTPVDRIHMLMVLSMHDCLFTRPQLISYIVRFPKPDPVAANPNLSGKASQNNGCRHYRAWITLQRDEGLAQKQRRQHHMDGKF